MARLEVSEPDGYRKVGTLPEGWRPPSYAVAPAYMAGATNNVFIDANTEGSVNVNSGESTGSYYGTLTFVVP